ncbi:MAG TPA: TMEM175 family protein, partial [Frankiaceae bacterium]|nr:TMEM175 family protein [Frankiaceae bacterium]
MTETRTQETTPTGQRALHPPGRLEAFGDGVFAIAITLLVLEIATPVLKEGSLLRGLAHEWPSFLAYGI